MKYAVQTQKERFGRFTTTTRHKTLAAALAAFNKAVNALYAEHEKSKHTRQATSGEVTLCLRNPMFETFSAVVRYTTEKNIVEEAESFHILQSLYEEQKAARA